MLLPTPPPPLPPPTPLPSPFPLPLPTLSHSAEKIQPKKNKSRRKAKQCGGEPKLGILHAVSIAESPAPAICSGESWENRLARARLVSASLEMDEVVEQ